MEFVTTEPKKVESNTDLNYAQFIKKTMKNVKDENITHDLELMLNTNFKVVQYKIGDGEYIVKFNTQIQPIYFHYDIESSHIFKSITNKIRMVPRISSRLEDGSDEFDYEVDFYGCIGNLLLDDIKMILFLKMVAVIYHKDDIINPQIQEEKIKFINFYPKFEYDISTKNFNEVIIPSDENIQGLGIKCYTCNFDKLSHNVYQVDIYGFFENLSEEDMEIYCEKEDQDLIHVKLVYDKNTNLVKVKSDIDTISLSEYSDEKLEKNDPTQVYYTNSFGEKFTTGFVPYLKSSNSQTGCDFIELINNVFITKPMIEVNYFQVNY